MFVTPSDLVRRLNESLTEQLGASVSATTTTTAWSDKTTARFELQKRRADGSAVPANAAEVQSLDFQAKLQQAASHVVDLPTHNEKLAWAEAQRQTGNDLYHQCNYTAAIDVYLTCLTAVAAVATTNTTDPSSPSQQYQQQQQQHYQRWLLWANILNNLALTTLQLEQYHKTIQFCTLGLQTLSEQQQSLPNQEEETTLRDNNNNFALDTQTSKLHYLRAKAHRLRGEYDSVVVDLDASEQFLRRQLRQQCGTEDDHNNNIKTKGMLQNIQQERQRLQRAQVQAQRHAQQQKQALQQLWMCSNDNDAAVPNNYGKPHPPLSCQPKTTTPGPLLYQDKTKSVPRLYSTLRAPTAAESNENDNDNNNDNDSFPDTATFSYWQWYLERLGRGSQRLLDWLDDEQATSSEARRIPSKLD